MIVRKYEDSDFDVLAKLFYETIHSVNRFDYTKEQLNAWAPLRRDMNEWQNSFKNKWVFVACNDSTIFGFGELESDGHLDRFYVSKDFIGKGIGRKIYTKIEETAIKQKISRLFVDASITARPFFEKIGFNVVKVQVVNLREVDFVNYSMEKILCS